MTALTNAERQARWRLRHGISAPMPGPDDRQPSGRDPNKKYQTSVKRRQPWDARTREKIKVGVLIRHLMKCAEGKVELSVTRLRAIEILLKKVVPDLSRVVVQADVTHRYVVRLPDVLSKEDWLQRYGDPKQIEGTTNGPSKILQ